MSVVAEGVIQGIDAFADLVPGHVVCPLGRRSSVSCVPSALRSSLSVKAPIASSTRAVTSSVLCAVRARFRPWVDGSGEAPTQAVRTRTSCARRSTNRHGHSRTRPVTARGLLPQHVVDRVLARPPPVIISDPLGGACTRFAGPSRAARAPRWWRLRWRCHRPGRGPPCSSISAATFPPRSGRPHWWARVSGIGSHPHTRQPVRWPGSPSRSHLVSNWCPPAGSRAAPISTTCRLSGWLMPVRRGRRPWSSTRDATATIGYCIPVPPDR